MFRPSSSGGNEEFSSVHENAWAAAAKSSAESLRFMEKRRRDDAAIAVSSGGFFASNSATSLTSLMVLVVDDSMVQRKLTRSSLAGTFGDYTYLVNTAESGEAAFEVVASSTKLPDVVIMDEDMTSAGGLLMGHQAVQKMRSNPIFDNVVIIGCTSYANDTADMFLEAGADAVRYLWIGMKL